MSTTMVGPQRNLVGSGSAKMVKFTSVSIISYTQNYLFQSLLFIFITPSTYIYGFTFIPKHSCKYLTLNLNKNYKDRSSHGKIWVIYTAVQEMSIVK